jgi:hypothetical protein
MAHQGSGNQPFGMNPNFYSGHPQPQGHNPVMSFGMMPGSTAPGFVQPMNTPYNGIPGGGMNIMMMPGQPYPYMANTMQNPMSNNIPSIPVKSTSLSVETKPMANPIDSMFGRKEPPKPATTPTLPIEPVLTPTKGTTKPAPGLQYDVAHFHQLQSDQTTISISERKSESLNHPRNLRHRSHPIRTKFLP